MASLTSADAAARALNCLGVDLDSYAVSDRTNLLEVFNEYFEERESDEDSNGSGKTYSREENVKLFMLVGEDDDDDDDGLCLDDFDEDMVEGRIGELQSCVLMYAG